MSDDEPEHKTSPTPELIAEAKLHATAWEYAAGSLSDNCNSIDLHQRMGVTATQLGVAKWLAYAVAGGYRRIVNGAKLDD